MQTIIMTVGTSLLKNEDGNLPNDKKRPWMKQKKIGDRRQAIAWMNNTDLELISAETNTLCRLEPRDNDEIILLHSETDEGKECAEVIQEFLKQTLNLKSIQVCLIPGIHYELDESASALERMAELLHQLIDQAKGVVTLAATGGFKAQAMMMGMIGHIRSIPVCYVHEAYRSLIYLPYLSNTGQLQPTIRQANLPNSGRPRSQVINVQKEAKGHHRPKSWKKVEKLLREGLLWVDNVYCDDNAFYAPINGMKSAPRKTPDGRHVLWIHLYESEKKKMAVAVEITGDTPEQLERAAAELREQLGRLL
jgi:putative CRISPR-associated protein (TIGR02619 family)